MCRQMLFANAGYYCWNLCLRDEIAYPAQMLAGYSQNFGKREETTVEVSHTNTHCILHACELLLIHCGGFGEPKHCLQLLWEETRDGETSQLLTSYSKVIDSAKRRVTTRLVLCSV